MSIDFFFCSFPRKAQCATIGDLLVDRFRKLACRVQKREFFSLALIFSIYSFYSLKQKKNTKTAEIQLGSINCLENILCLWQILKARKLCKLQCNEIAHLKFLSKKSNLKIEQNFTLPCLLFI
ncbi:hypothetical protein BpHYR1_028143 [Brachionus plicatilis]|uniref:Uncharacterized protein n=1 Tax=Brachionus plicatilis TaxID=10195 RepID=A0A3M7PN32_BRAPC|nr:hypothetical protein BpHYR1_028143 [Brachionus plicatilis]